MHSPLCDGWPGRGVIVAGREGIDSVVRGHKEKRSQPRDAQTMRRVTGAVNVL